VRTRSLAAVLGATAAALVLAACSGSGDSSARESETPLLPSPTPTPTETIPPKPPKPPHARTCYRLGYDDALAPTRTRKPVPCTDPHSGVTFFVGQYRRSLPVDGAAVHRLESTACSRRFAAFVGGTPEERRLSLLRSIWFTPTVEQASKGAHWFECVAIALRDDEHLALIQGPVEGVLDRTNGREHYALCGTAEPGSAGFVQRICAAPHSWVALRTVSFQPGRYPGIDRVRSAGQQPCKDAGANASDDPLHYRWSYQWPTLRQWQAGHTYGVCWAPS
jgi:putative regulator of septum formation